LLRLPTSPIEGNENSSRKLRKIRPETFKTLPTALQPRYLRDSLHFRNDRDSRRARNLPHLNLMSNVTSMWRICRLDFTDGVQKTVLITLSAVLNIYRGDVPG